MEPCPRCRAPVVVRPDALPRCPRCAAGGSGQGAGHAPTRDRVALILAVAAWVLPAVLLAPMAWEEATTYDHGNDWEGIGWFFLGVLYVLAGGILSAAALATSTLWRRADAGGGSVARGWTEALITPFLVGVTLLGTLVLFGLAQWMFGR